MGSTTASAVPLLEQDEGSNRVEFVDVGCVSTASADWQVLPSGVQEMLDIPFLRVFSVRFKKRYGNCDRLLSYSVAAAL